MVTKWYLLLPFIYFTVLFHSTNFFSYLYYFSTTFCSGTSVISFLDSSQRHAVMQRSACGHWRVRDRSDWIITGIVDFFSTKHWKDQKMASTDVAFRASATLTLLQSVYFLPLYFTPYLCRNNLPRNYPETHCFLYPKIVLTSTFYKKGIISMLFWITQNEGYSVRTQTFVYWKSTIVIRSTE